MLRSGVYLHAENRRSHRSFKLELPAWVEAIESEICIRPALLSAKPIQAWFSFSWLPTPSLRRNVIIGHQLLNPDWNKLRPTKAVKRYQYSFTQWPRANEPRIKSPAIKRSVRSIVIIVS